MYLFIFSFFSTYICLAVSVLNIDNFRRKMEGKPGSSSSSRAIDSSNVGFQLLKKCGWKEGTGLGVAEQGLLEPVQVHLKNNKSGIGIEKTEKRAKHLDRELADLARNEKHKKKEKPVSKKIRKILEEEENRKERDFERAFFMDFWPDNV